MEKAISETRPDIVVIATNSFVEEVLTKIETVAKHHVDILTIAERDGFSVFLASRRVGGV